MQSLGTDMIGWELEKTGPRLVRARKDLGGIKTSALLQHSPPLPTTRVISPIPGLLLGRRRLWFHLIRASGHRLVLSSAFTLTIFSQHRAGARRRVYRGEDGAKEQRAELLGWGSPRLCTGLGFMVF